MSLHSRGTIPTDLPIAAFSFVRAMEPEKRSSSAPPTSSAENSPLLDRDSILRYSVSSRDEFWDALSSNYDYLMDDGLIATCREASSDLSLDDEFELEEACCWTFTRFIEQFKWLHDLLHNLQVAKEDDTKERSLKIYEEHQKIAYLCKLFNEQAQKLCQRYPDMRDEVHRRLNLLNNKWKAVEQSINPNVVKSPSKDVMYDEITNHMCSVRRVLRELESRICPVSSASSWKQDTLEENYRLQLALQKEIESKGKHVSVLIKLCEHLKGNVRFGQSSLMTWDAGRVRKVANNLQHRWHTIWLKSLECICLMENLMGGPNIPCEKLEKSFSEEPLKKYPRLSSTFESLSKQLENELSKTTMASKPQEDLSASVPVPGPSQKDEATQKNEVTVKNDKAVMVGATGIAELKADCGSGKFEIIQDIGYSSETSVHLSTEERTDSPPDRIAASVTPMYLAPDKYPSVSLKTFNLLTEDKTFYSSRHNATKKAPDTFYKVACVDDELLEDLFPLELETMPPLEMKETENSPVLNLPCKDKQVITSTPQKVSPAARSQTVSSKNELVASQTTPKTHRLVEKCNIKNLLKSIEKECKQSIEIASSSKKSRRNSKVTTSRMPHRQDDLGKTDRVSEWLNTCQSLDDYTSDDNQSTKIIKGDWSPKVVNSSCDASGECTTAESDSEKSTTSDVNNSVTFSQSFTGSIETVIPVGCEEGNRVQSGSLEPSPGSVQLRKKKRANRNRPWSVIELNESTFTHSASVPHSTSDGALDQLCSAQDTGRTLSIKLCPKRKSLADISLFASPSLKAQTSPPKEQNSSEAEHPIVLKNKESISDHSSDNCGTLLCSPNVDAIESPNSILPLLSLELSNCANTTTDGQIVFPAALSLETDIAECTASIEDQGSLSDQAWDEYQDPPYLSEPYSEQTVDEDEVRKLISFGDDYRATLGSYSDASSISLRLPPPRHRTRTRSTLAKSKCGDTCNSTDSNSDCEDFHHILKTSSRAFQFVSSSIKENTRKMSSELAELVATCQTNLCHLNAIAAAGCELESVSREDVLKLQDLIKDWEELQVKLLVLSRNDREPTSSSSINLAAAKADVQSSLTSLKLKLAVMAEHATCAIDTAISLNQIANNIQNLQMGLSNLQDMKESVLSVSARILRLISEGGGHSLAPLRESATKLYQQWEDVYELNCSQLTKLQKLQSGWSESTEETITEDQEMILQWQPVQVGDNLPTAQLKREALHPQAAAEVLAADQHDTLLELQNLISLAHPCILVEERKEEERLQVPLVHLNLPVQKLSDAKSSGSAECDAPTNSPKSRSCLWRTLRAAFPIQVVLIAIYCLSCLSMEPQCCENMNNYDFSILPQLRYLHGPPPV